MNTLKVANVWLDSVRNLTDVFTKPGTAHFGKLLTGALLVERRPLITEIITALDCQEQWRATEWFMEEGRWPTEESSEGVAGKMTKPSGRGQTPHTFKFDANLHLHYLRGK